MTPDLESTEGWVRDSSYQGPPFDGAQGPPFDELRDHPSTGAQGPLAEMAQIKLGQNKRAPEFRGSLETI
ncbi:MAG: hypothetical protein L3J79_04190 [Candidatus Marinimicrobia bacterium]|nr:hypothetical protein [Candidatus Neomarinimicrobiota bacterium]